MQIFLHREVAKRIGDGNACIITLFGHPTVTLGHRHEAALWMALAARWRRERDPRAEIAEFNYRYRIQQASIEILSGEMARATGQAMRHITASFQRLCLAFSDAPSTAKAAQAMKDIAKILPELKERSPWWRRFWDRLCRRT